LSSSIINNSKVKLEFKIKYFIHSLINCYRSIVGPEFREINVDGKIPEVQARVLEVISECIPGLESNQAKRDLNN